MSAMQARYGPQPSRSGATRSACRSFSARIHRREAGRALDPSRAVGDGSGRKTDDAAAVAVAGLRSRDLQVVRPDDTVEILPLLSTRRQEVVAPRIATVNRLHEVLCQLIPVGRNGI
jgi:hypothetical protein